MKSYFEKVSAIIGREVTSHEELTAEEYAMVTEAMNIDNSSAGSGDPSSEAGAALTPEAVSEMVTSAVNSAIEPVSSQLGSISSRLEALEEVSPAAKPANPGATDPDAGSEELDPWDDPANPLNAQIANDLGE